MSAGNQTYLTSDAFVVWLTDLWHYLYFPRSLFFSCFSCIRESELGELIKNSRQKGCTNTFNKMNCTLTEHRIAFIYTLVISYAKHCFYFFILMYFFRVFNIVFMSSVHTFLLDSIKRSVIYWAKCRRPFLHKEFTAFIPSQIGTRDQIFRNSVSTSYCVPSHWTLINHTSPALYKYFNTPTFFPLSRKQKRIEDEKKLT